MDRLPTLVISPGMPFEAAAAASEAPLPPPAGPGDVGYTAPGGPHVWVLRIGDREIAFPPSRFTAIEVGDGRVARVRATPQLDYLSPAEAAALAGTLRELLRGAGFTEAEEVAPEKIVERLAAEGEVRACRFRAGEWMGEVRVTRVIEAGSAAARAIGLKEDACLVSCAIWDVRGAAALVG